MAADAEGAYVHADENILDPSGSGAYILHIDGRTGTEVWRTRAEQLGIASLEAGTLLVTNEVWTKARGLSSRSGKVLYGLDASSILLWRNRWLLMTDESMLVVDSANGSTLHTLKPLPVRPSDAGLVRIDGDVMLYQAEDRLQAVAYDLAREELLWQKPVLREIAERFGCAADVVMLRPMEPKVFLAHVRNDVLVGCSLTDASILWDMRVPYAAPAVPHRDRVYVMLSAEASESSPRLVCLDAVSGARVHDVAIAEMKSLDYADYGRVHEDHIAFGTRGGFIGLFRLEDARLAWWYRYIPKDTGVWAHTPVMAGERLYAAAEDGNLLIFEAASATI